MYSPHFYITSHRVMTREQILEAAKNAPAKVKLEEHREAVEALREKGFTWREIADFLNEHGLNTDHTRVYRAFGQQSNQQRRTETKTVDIARITYMGERLTKRKKAWKVMDIELPSRLGKPITVVGYAWGTGTAPYELGEDNTITFRDATLVVKTGSNFPMAYIKAEFLSKGEFWSAQEVYIVPKWEVLL